MLVCRIYAKRRHFQFSTGSLVAAWINRWTKAKNCVNKGASLMRDGICFCLHCQHCDTTTTRGKRRRKKPKWNSKLIWHAEHKRRRLGWLNDTVEGPRIERSLWYFQCVCVSWANEWLRQRTWRFDITAQQRQVNDNHKNIYLIYFEMR